MMGIFDTEYILEEKRSQWPDEVFGIPEERKYPMPDKKHTESAIKLFNHVEAKYEAELAHNIIKNIKKFDVDVKIIGPKNRLRNYLPKEMLMEVKRRRGEIDDSTSKKKEDTKKSVEEYGTTAGTIVGANQSADDVYIVNYTPKNTFSREVGICKKGMNNIHIFINGELKPISRKAFKDIAEDVRVFRYKGSIDFCMLIECAIDKDDIMYLLTDKKDEYDFDRILYGEEFIEEACFSDILEATESICTANALKCLRAKTVLPILTRNEQGRSYNYYRDIDGEFIMNEITKMRSSSYKSINDIPKEEINIVKRGVLL